jgi:4-hydroxy-L-threonine phosphate dehydrogenase PdxA
LGFDTGVNVTVGLPFGGPVSITEQLSTLPDGKAKHASMLAAIDLARTLVLSKETSDSGK